MEFGRLWKMMRCGDVRKVLDLFAERREGEGDGEGEWKLWMPQD